MYTGGDRPVEKIEKFERPGVRRRRGRIATRDCQKRRGRRKEKGDVDVVIVDTAGRLTLTMS